METRIASRTEVSRNKPRLSVAIVRDKSGSMAGNPIESENKAIEKFLEQKNIGITGRRTDICIVGFDSNAYVEMDWVQMDQATPELDNNASGMTDLDSGIMLALDKLKNKRMQDNALGIPPSAPLLIVLTDGAPTSSIERSVEEINMRLQKKDKNGLNTFMMMSIFMDDPQLTESERETALKTLSRYSGGVFTANTRQYNEIFSFIHDSIKAIYESGGTQKVLVNPQEHGMKYVTLN